MSSLKFIKSAVTPNEYPQQLLNEIAIVGRSNAGKSSLINALFKTRLAKVSRTPGKTRLINFYQWGQTLSLVDTPGYGFASRSDDEIKMWKTIVETYFQTRKQLKCCFILIDARRFLEDEEKLLINYFKILQIPYVFVFTKIDKLNKKQLSHRKIYWKNIISNETYFFTSSFNHHGIEHLRSFLSQFCSK